MTAAAMSGRLTTLDYILSVMDTAQSSVDFAILFHFNDKLDLGALRRGAQSARRRFPNTGSRLLKNTWVWNSPSSEAIDTANCRDASTTIESFVNRPFDLQREFPVQQLVVSIDDNETILVTRFHHAAADGMSAALWLRHQLEVAGGIIEVEPNAHAYEPPPLRSVASPVRKSRFAYSVPSDRLITSTAFRSGLRSWESIVIDTKPLRKSIRKLGGFTYSDLLATCALEVYAQWNNLHQANQRQNISLWLPINVRQRANEGFGNGTSRVRVYATYSRKASLVEKCREVRRQIEWCTTNGEWVVPNIKGLVHLPRSLSGPLLRRNLARRSVDMATGVFSHADRWNSAQTGVFDLVERIECIGLLHPFHALAINGATHRGKTWLTFTYDNGLLARSDVTQLKELYEQHINLALEQLQ
ncbi:MAG TPA: hypothetical protein VLA93_21340 [Pyrinomonadaceae bacterium]|nr:hypothetical protein [Pyrinomonadaceae bacterium]